MSELNGLDITISLDHPGEISHALAVTSKLAKMTGKTHYIYSYGHMLFMTDHYPAVPRKDIVAKCYPGGRNELWRVQI